MLFRAKRASEIVNKNSRTIVKIIDLLEFAKTDGCKAADKGMSVVHVHYSYVAVSVYLSIYLFIYLSIYLFIYLSIYLPIYLSTVVSLIAMCIFFSVFLRADRLVERKIEILKNRLNKRLVNLSKWVDATESDRLPIPVYRQVLSTTIPMEYRSTAFTRGVPAGALLNINSSVSRAHAPVAALPVIVSRPDLVASLQNR